MTPVVVDASALAEYLLRTSRGLALDRVLTDVEHDFHAPALCDLEVMAVFRRGLLGGHLAGDRAAEAIEDLRDLPLTRHGHQKLLDEVFLMRWNFSVCDAAYVALAELLGASLLTDDLRLARAVSKHSRVRLLEA